MCVCVCVCGGGGGSVGKCAICDRVQLLTFAKARNRFLTCFIGSTFASEIDHVQQGGERMENGGTVTCLGGHGPPTDETCYLSDCSTNNIFV